MNFNFIKTFFANKANSSLLTYSRIMDTKSKDPNPDPMSGPGPGPGSCQENETNEGIGIGNEYKIMLRRDKQNENIFLVHSSDPKNHILNSQSLMKLLALKELPKDLLTNMFDNKTKSTEMYVDQMIEISSIMMEDNIFFNFNPYINFLLDNDTKKTDIRDVTKKTRTDSLCENDQYDHSQRVNPYGLEKVVFTGGGTKGIIYIGAIIGLFATGQIFYLDHYSGTSVGAITAMVFGSMTPCVREYERIRGKTLKDILTNEKSLIQKYQKAIGFAMERFCERSIHTFYALPTYSFYSLWTAFETIARNNGLYDPEKSGFQIWYALICKRICQIMGNGLDKLIIIKKKNGKIVEFEEAENKEADKETVKKEADKKEEAKNPENKGKEVSQNDKSKEVSQNEKSKDKDKDNDEINFDTDTYDGWELVRFFTFQEYWSHTKKTIVMTGTETERLETVYYTHTNSLYKDLSVMVGAHASMSIPWVFKPPIINGSYHLDGGIFDNYPLTHCDKKNKDLITHYNNRIFGYLIDDKNTMIEAYEILKELWLVYNGFIEIMNIGYIKDSPDYSKISELFFEIRSEIYKLLYFADVDIETFLNVGSDRECVPGFNIRDLEEIYGLLLAENELTNIDVDMIEDINSVQCNNETERSQDYEDFLLPDKGIEFITTNLKILDSKYRNIDSTFKIGRRTNIDDIMELATIQGMAHNILSTEINRELTIIGSMDKTLKTPTVDRYEIMLTHLMRDILSYYELKGNFVKSNNSVNPGKFLAENLKNLHKNLTEFNTLTDNAVALINKNVKTDQIIKNWISNNIQIASTTIKKILKQGSVTNIDSPDIETTPIKEKSSYQKIYDYFFNINMLEISFKYMCIVNNVCNDSFNRMRTIRLNTYEASTLNFKMDQELKGRLIFEGFSKTIKYFTNLLNIMEKTKRIRADSEFLESLGIRYMKMNT